MKKIWIPLIFVLLLTVCTACQTETPVPATPTPNPYAYFTFEDFCQAAVEGNLENALELVTEDIKINYVTEIEDGYEEEFVGHSGVEDLLAKFKEWEVYDCTVRYFRINGDEINLWWTEYSPCFGYECTASCDCNATMQGKKIQKIVNDCIYEYWDIDEN
jgi:hypothetical protein